MSAWANDTVTVVRSSISCDGFLDDGQRTRCNLLRLGALEPEGLQQHGCRTLGKMLSVEAKFLKYTCRRCIRRDEVQLGSNGGQNRAAHRKKADERVGDHEAFPGNTGADIA